MPFRPGIIMSVITRSKDFAASNSRASFAEACCGTLISIAQSSRKQLANLILIIDYENAPPLRSLSI